MDIEVIALQRLMKAMDALHDSLETEALMGTKPVAESVVATRGTFLEELHIAKVVVQDWMAICVACVNAGGDGGTPLTFFWKWFAACLQRGYDDAAEAAAKASADASAEAFAAAKNADVLTVLERVLQRAARAMARKCTSDGTHVRLRQIVEDCTATHDAALFSRCKFERHKASPLVHPSKKHGGGKPRQAQAALLQCRLQTSLQQYLQSSCRVLQHVVVISVLGVGCFGRGDASVRSHTKTLSNVACVLASNVMRSIQEFHCINDGKHEMRLELEALTTAVCGMCVYSAAVWATDLAATMSAAKPCRGTASGVSSIIQLLQQAMQFEEFKAVRSNPAQAFACAIVCIMNVLLVKDVQVCMDVAMLTNMYGMATKCVAKLRSGGSPFLEACSATLHVVSAALRGVDGDGTDGGRLPVMAASAATAATAATAASTASKMYWRRRPASASHPKQKQRSRSQPPPTATPHS
jgi:hypothetical protein